jgi:hypothetical protein
MQSPGRTLDVIFDGLIFQRLRSAKATTFRFAASTRLYLFAERQLCFVFTLFTCKRSCSILFRFCRVWPVRCSKQNNKLPIAAV